MKKLFSKKSGFTLVEIIMAFLIFAIMAGMILAVLRLAIDQRRANNEWANELDVQIEKLVTSDKEKSSTDYADGKITLKTTDGTNLASINYALAGVTDSDNEEGINYFIGEYNNLKGSDLTNNNFDGDGKAVNKRVDSRIYGSTGFNEIRMYKIIRDTSYTGTGVRYIIECSAGNIKKLDTNNKEINSFNSELTPYRQYILFFPNQNILESGYYDGVSSFKNSKRTSTIPTNNYYSVQDIGKQSILISISPSGESDFENAYHTNLYVVFESDPGILPAGINSTASLTTEQKKEAFSYFGDNVKMVSDDILEYAYFTSASADTLVNNGKEEDEKVRCDNIYGVKSTPVDVGDPDEDSET